MQNQLYPKGGRLAAGEVGNEDNAGVINVPNTEIPPVISSSPHPDMAQVHEVKINGEVQKMTVEQLIAATQKGGAADENFRKASDLTKENASAINLQEDFNTIMGADDDAAEDAFRRIGEEMGVPQDEIDRITDETFGEEEEEGDPIDAYDDEISTRRTQREPVNEGPIDYSRLAPDVQRALRMVENNRIKEIVQTAIDSDEVVSYNMKLHDVKGQAAIRAYVDEKIRGRLDAFGGDFGDGNRILAEILPEVRDHLQALGTPKSRGPLGLGQSPGGGDMEVYPKKRPDHVSSTEGDAFEQNILETIAYEQVKAEQGNS